MNKWLPILVLGLTQFVMVLDGTVMNVSITQVVTDLGTTTSNMQLAIATFTLTMAALMLAGAGLGTRLGLRRTFVIGNVIYAIGSLTTAFAPGFASLFIGWSLVEGLGAALVVPAIAALAAVNYSGRERAMAYAVLGGIAGAASAAGPLIGGWMTTYLSWRWVFGFDWSGLFGWGLLPGANTGCCATGTSLFHRKSSQVGQKLCLGPNEGRPKI